MFSTVSKKVGTTETDIVAALRTLKVKLLLLADLSGTTNTVTLKIYDSSGNVLNSVDITLNAYEKFIYHDSDLPILTVPMGGKLSCVASAGDVTVIVGVEESAV